MRKIYRLASSDAPRDIVEIGMLGYAIMESYGKIENLDPHKIAGQKAADTRWGRTVERATHQGQIHLDDITLDCFVIEDGRRIISQASIMAALGRSTSSGRRTRNDNMPPFVEANNLQPFITPELRENLERLEYRVGDEKQVRSGYNAEILPRICNVYLAADDHGVLTANQRPAVVAAQVLVRALALVGITALVDEATGYQETRAANELQRLLDAYVHEEFKPWIKRFPEVFFKEVYRIHGWEFFPGKTKHTPYVGHFINEYIYKPMPAGVLQRLRELNPINEQGNRARKHHQHLSEDMGVKHLERQISTVVTLMQVSDDKQEFEQLFNKADSRNRPVQTMMKF